MELLSISFSFLDRLGDDQCRRHLENLLSMRRRAEAGEPISKQHTEGAAEMVALLAEALLGWISDRLKLKISLEELNQLTPNETRSLIVRSLDRNLPIMQREVCAELVSALGALNAGKVYPLLQRNPGRRREAPESSAEAELKILKWIRWKRGLGGKVKDVEAEAAAAVGCTDRTFTKWRVELAKVFGAEEVRSELEVAERIGRHEAAGKTLQDVDRYSSDENLALWEGTLLLERDLKILAELRLRSIAKRERSPRKRPEGT